MTHELNLYDAIKAAGIPTDNHESDLYFPVSLESTSILARYEAAKITKLFTHQVDGSRWYDVPFAYTPWWTAKQAKGVR